MSCYSAILSIRVPVFVTTTGFKNLKTCYTYKVAPAGLLGFQQQETFHKFCGSSLVGFKQPTKVDRVPREIVGPEPEKSRRLCSFQGNFKLEPLPLSTTNTITKRDMSSKADKLKIVIFYGSTRNGRMCDRVGTLIKNAIEANGLEAIVLDPLKLPVEMLKLPLHFMPNPAEAPQWMLETNDTIKNADGFIFVSAEYNCTLPPALTNLIDHFPPPSYRHRPVGVVTYSLGQFGGTRAAVLLRPFASELGLFSIPATVTIPVVNNAVDEQGNAAEERLSTNVTKLVKELEWYAAGLKAHRANNPPPT